MNKLLLLFCIFFLNHLAFGQAFFTESFETDGNGTRYTTLIPEFSDGAGDFFTRTDASNITGTYSVTGIDGSFWFAAMDIDGEGASSQQTLTINGIDISGRSGLSFSIAVAEDDDGSNQDWDSADFVRIEYEIDGNGVQNLICFENDGTTTNAAPELDTDCDGTGDGTNITNTFQTFTANIPGTGTSMDIIITFNLNAGDEDLSIDNIQISGTQVVAPVPTMSQWGLLIFGLLILNLGVFYVQRLQLA